MKRTFTGLGLFTALMGLILFTGVEVKGVKIGQFFFDAVLLLVTAVASLEIYKAFKSKDYKPTLIPLAIYFAIIYPLVYFFQFRGYAIAAAIALILSFCFFIFDCKVKINDFLATLFVLIYPLMSLTLSFYIVRVYGMLPLLVAVGAAMCADTVAFYFGSLIKGPKIFPKISPKKTYSGSIIGIFGGVLGSVLVYVLFELANLPVNDVLRFTQILKHPILFYCFLGGAIGIISEIGDLAASRVKRELQIKDFSKAFGSHGGIMDRADSIIFALIFITIVMAFVG